MQWLSCDSLVDFMSLANIIHILIIFFQFKFFKWFLSINALLNISDIYDELQTKFCWFSLSKLRLYYLSLTSFQLFRIDESIFLYISSSSDAVAIEACSILVTSAICTFVREVKRLLNSVVLTIKTTIVTNIKMW